MPDVLTKLYQRINRLDRQVAALSRRDKTDGWQLPAVFDTHQSGGGKLIWGFDGHSIHAHGYNAVWAENNIDPSNYRAATYGGPNVTLNGTDDYLSIADAAWQETDTEEMLVWGWCYLTNIASSRTIAAKYLWSSDDRSWTLRYDSTPTDFVFLCNATGLGAANVTVISTYGSVAVDNWYFVAGYFQPSTLMRVYVGHNEDAELTIDSNTTSIPASLHDGSAALTIGADSNPSTYFFGRIGRAMGRANVPVANIDGYVTTLFEMTQDFYQE